MVEVAPLQPDRQDVSPLLVLLGGCSQRLECPVDDVLQLQVQHSHRILGLDALKCRSRVVLRQRSAQTREGPLLELEEEGGVVDLGLAFEASSGHFLLLEDVSLVSREALGEEALQISGGDELRVLGGDVVLLLGSQSADLPLQVVDGGDHGEHLL